MGDVGQRRQGAQVLGSGPGIGAPAVNWAVRRVMLRANLSLFVADCITAIQGALCSMQSSDVWLGALWWAAGPWWGTVSTAHVLP